MFNKPKVFLLLAAMIFFSVFAAFAESLKTEQYFDSRISKYVEVVAGQILVKFKPSVSISSIKAANQINGVQIVTRLPELDVYQLSSVVSVPALLAAYRADPSVEYAEPNFIYYPMSTTPNDPSFSKQWGLTNIKAPQAWDLQKGTSEIIVAIIDSGADMTHEDLKNRVIAGWDYIDNDNVPNDVLGHGTHVAGIIGAETNNSIGVAGVTWGCKLLAIKVFGADGLASSTNVISALAYAASHGAKVINMSLGSSSFSNTYNNAIQSAHNSGCVIVASAGNDGDGTINYPASYDNVISVAAVDQDDNRSSYSTYNAYVDVCAPGGKNILHSTGATYSTLPSYHVAKNDEGYYNNYDYMAGTSMAAPFVSGFAGLIFSQHPTWPTASVEALLLSSVDHLGSAGRNNEYGYGRINIYKAFNSTPPSPPSAPIAQQNRNQITLSWAATTQSNIEKYLIYRSVNAAGPFTLTASVDASQTSYTDTITQEGTYYYKISLLNAAGLESALSVQASVTVSFSLPDAFVYPNPLTLGPSAQVVFGGLSGNETIRIYTMTGELVNSIQLHGATQGTWNATNSAGNSIARGIYIYLITRPTGEKRVGKIAVIN